MKMVFRVLLVVSGTLHGLAARNLKDGNSESAIGYLIAAVFVLGIIVASRVSEYDR